MLLSNIHTIDGVPVDIGIGGNKISSIGINGINRQHSKNILFENAIAFPGLINSHDHLDFNCFSPVNKRKYNNYTEWGEDIHSNYKNEINAVLKIPIHLRAAWGMYKNLLAGVTTVVNHGAVLNIDHPLIDIHQQQQDLHSVGFEKNWKWKLNHPLQLSKICVMHVGEGTDQSSRSEIDELLQHNYFKRKIIGIHGVAMTTDQAEKFAGLVWCPVSNEILLSGHARIDRLKAYTPIVFGTDSTLTGDWNTWDHLRFARSLELVNDEELFYMTNEMPARLWNLQTGRLKAGYNADIVVIKNSKNVDPLVEFYNANPENILMVLHKGNIRMFDEEILNQLNDIDLNKFHHIVFGDSVKYVEGDLHALVKEIKHYYPSWQFPFTTHKSKMPA